MGGRNGRDEWFNPRRDIQKKQTGSGKSTKIITDRH
jgi:hypothetical protein